MADTGIQTSLEYIRSRIREIWKIPESTKDAEFLLLEKIEFMHDICMDKSGEDYTIRDEDLRLSNFLVLLAVFMILDGEKGVLFLSPTHYYAMQAYSMGQKYLTGLGHPDTKFPVAIPMHEYFNGAVRDAKILLMHGKDFTEYLPNGWKGRKIVQLFEDEDVPVNPRIIRPCCYAD
jgi:hypothetical protein